MVDKKNKGIDIGIKVKFEPGYWYFVSRNEIYRISKKLAIRDRKVTDPAILKKIRIFNAKLREKIGEIPIDIYQPRRIYCVRRDGSIGDYGELKGLFPNPYYNRIFSD